MDLHKFALQILSQIYKNWGVNICKHGKCQSFTELFTPPVFWYANMALTIFAIYLLFGSDIFAMYLQHICKAQELTWAHVLVYLFLMFVCLTLNTRCFSLAVQNNSPIQECKKNHRDLYPPLSLPQLCVCHKYMCTCGQFNTTFTSLIYKCSYFLVSENNNCTCKLYL